MHIAEKHPESRLLPPVATLERTECYKWVSFILTELKPPLWTIAKHRFALPKERRVPAAIDTAAWEFEVAVKILAAGLGARPYLVENSFTVADILPGHTLLWVKSTRLELRSDSLSGSLSGRADDARRLRARSRKTPCRLNTTGVARMPLSNGPHLIHRQLVLGTDPCRPTGGIY